MKITNVNKGKPYHLSPGTKLKIERPNLFFNEYGEQTTPVNLPDTDQNRELLDYPDLLSKKQKPVASISATIEDDGYFMPCRQAILSAQRKKSIETSFYMNEGSFLSKIADTSLSDVFGAETIPGLSTVDECIAFCRSLVSGNDPHYAIFPVLISSGDSYSDGTPKYAYINRYGFIDSDGNFRDSIFLDPTAPLDFYNAVPRTMADGDTNINLAAGYYISPFIRGNYLLQRIFSYFGYTLKDNFFTRTSPFPDMVFINNCADSIILGSIRITDLLPDCSCSTILEVYRKKFCCEFVPDEVNHAVDILLFNDVVNAEPQADLSPYLTSQIQVEYPEAYKQLIISSEDQIASPQEVETFDSIADLYSKYKSLYLDPVDGAFYRSGYYIWPLYGSVSAISIADKVAEFSMRYYSGGNLKTEEITVPDCQPVMVPFQTDKVSGSNIFNSNEDTFLYIGEANFLNSKLMAADTAEVEPSSKESTTSDVTLKPMLAFAYNSNNYPRGTISNYAKTVTDSLSEPYTRLFNYTLSYNGSDGIFERFYRKLDDIYRNSMHTVTADLLLPANVKQSLSAHLPVNLKGENLLVNILKYTIGGKIEPIETSFYTYRLYEPVTSAKLFSEYNPFTGYSWKFNKTEKTLTQAQYESSPYRDKEFVTVFLPPATKEDADSGKRFFVQHTALTYRFGDYDHYNEYEVWFAAVKDSDI